MPTNKGAIFGHQPALKDRHGSKSSTAHCTVGHLDKLIHILKSAIFLRRTLAINIPTSYLACAAVRSNLVEVGAGDVDPSHDQVGADVTLVPGKANLSHLTNHLLTFVKTP